MFCHKCGNENLVEGSAFCPRCGTKLQVDTSNNKTSNTIVDIKKYGSVFCPKCKSKNLQAIVETNTQGNGRGYGAGKGLIGYLLLGPLGLLCGACGSKAKITTTNKTFFICMDCGNKFREAAELEAEKSKESTMSFIIGAGLIVLGILMLQDEGLWGVGMMLFGGLVVLTGFDDKKASEELRAVKYEAKYYKTKKDDEK